MDQRLKQVRQTDLAEGRLNEEFLDWLRTKGVTWLLFVMIGLCVYFGIVRWRTHRVNTAAQGWEALVAAKTPSAFEEIATKYSNVDSVPLIARLNAAQRYMVALQSDQTIAIAEGGATSALTEADRTSYLDKADRLYQEVLSADDKTGAKVLFMVTALNGRAAVAESRGNLEESKSFYEQAAARAGTEYPGLAEQARANAANVGTATRLAALPSATDAAASFTKAPQLTPVLVDPWLSEMLFPPTEDESDG